MSQKYVSEYAGLYSVFLFFLLMLSFVLAVVSVVPIFTNLKISDYVLILLIIIPSVNVGFHTSALLYRKYLYADGGERFRKYRDYLVYSIIFFAVITYSAHHKFEFYAEYNFYIAVISAVTLFFFIVGFFTSYSAYVYVFEAEWKVANYPRLKENLNNLVSTYKRLLAADGNEKLLNLCYAVQGLECFELMQAVTKIMENAIKKNRERRS